MVEVTITSIVDQWPELRQSRRKLIVVSGVCTISFLFGLIFLSPVCSLRVIDLENLLIVAR
jgi:hypothetical protein